MTKHEIEDTKFGLTMLIVTIIAWLSGYIIGLTS